MIKVGIYGSSGKMGKMIFDCLKNYENISATALFTIEPLDYDPHNLIVTDNLKVLFENCDVVIDFTIKQASLKLLEFAKNNPKNLVIGTTALGEEGEILMNECAKKMAIFQASNMSLGVAILNKLVEIASQKLRDFDCEIIEMHHKFKKDAPSGTAMSLAKTAANARNLNLEKVRISGRDGMIGERKKDEIAVMSLRGGDIVGRHRVGFYGDGEFIELNHTATSRATFANGAIKAAIFISDKKIGRFDIQDCLGL